MLCAVPALLLSVSKRSFVNVKLILASESPRRQQLIRQLGLPFEAVISGADESVPPRISPADYVTLVALRKAEAVLERFSPHPDARQVIIAADTTVALHGEMLGKPATPSEARDMLLLLRGRTHQVHTGLAVLEVGITASKLEVHTADVTMRTYSFDEIEQYVASGDPMDKAGAYGIQDPVFRPVSHLDGCYLGVMGLSLCHLINVLAGFDVPMVGDIEQVGASHRGYACPLYPTALSHYF